VNKFNAKRVINEEGIFASQKEYKRWMELKILERSGEITALKKQVPYVLIAKSDKFERCRYIADFEYRDKNGNIVVEDAKGCKTGASYEIFKIKKKLMYAVHNIEVLEV